MPVEKLDVVVDVLVEVSTADERPADRANCIDQDSEREQNDCTETTAREPLEPGEGTSERASKVLRAQAGFRSR
jgi:hypothetical protein